MPNKILKLLVFIFVLPVFLQSAFAQVNCERDKIFNEKLCVGDELNQQEKELIQIVNEYRKQNGLTPVPLSEPLSIVANRRLLDLTKNITYITHSWSNCPYEIKDAATWNCVLEAPKRLNVGYKGSGYENLYRNLRGVATPPLALEAWKKSEMHNSLILNLDTWKEVKFDAFGIAIDGQFAALWFGSSGSAVNFSNQNAGLGVTFEKAVSGLTNVVSIEKKSSTGDSEFWTGASPDKSVMLQVSGRKEDISEATIGIRVRLEKGNRLSPKNRNILSVFLTNLVSEWITREKWLDATVKKLQQNSKQSETATQGKKVIVMGVDAEGYLSITVKPNKKPVAKEL